MSSDQALAAHRPVIVAGAGPAGMATALALRTEGLPVTVLEAGPAGRLRPGSRALVVHRSTLRLLESYYLGLGDEIVRGGLACASRRTFWQGQEVYHSVLPRATPDGLPETVALPQARTEALLYDACKTAGVDFVWDTTVIEARAHSAGVDLACGSRRWTAEYVIAADGARSAVRQSAGIELDGERSGGAFVSVDVSEDPADPLPAERVVHVGHPAMDGRRLVLTPFTGGWRLDVACRPDDDLEALGAADTVRNWLMRVMPDRYGDRITWVAAYRWSQVLAREFTDRHRRVLLVGEAAHQLAPYGARALNASVAGAAAAARAVRTGLEASDRAVAARAIEEYARSRRVSAERDLLATSRTPARPSWRVLHRVRCALAARVALAGRRAGAWLDAASHGVGAGRHGETG